MLLNICCDTCYTHTYTYYIYVHSIWTSLASSLFHLRRIHTYFYQLNQRQSAKILFCNWKSCCLLACVFWCNEFSKFKHNLKARTSGLGWWMSVVYVAAVCKLRQAATFRVMYWNNNSRCSSICENTTCMYHTNECRHQPKTTSVLSNNTSCLCCCSCNESHAFYVTYTVRSCNKRIILQAVKCGKSRVLMHDTYKQYKHTCVCVYLATKTKLSSCSPFASCGQTPCGLSINKYYVCSWFGRNINSICCLK